MLSHALMERALAKTSQNSRILKNVPASPLVRAQARALLKKDVDQGERDEEREEERDEEMDGSEKPYDEPFEFRRNSRSFSGGKQT